MVAEQDPTGMLDKATLTPSGVWRRGAVFWPSLVVPQVPGLISPPPWPIEPTASTAVTTCTARNTWRRMRSMCAPSASTSSVPTPVQSVDAPLVPTPRWKHSVSEGWMSERGHQHRQLRGQQHALFKYCILLHYCPSDTQILTPNFNLHMKLIIIDYPGVVLNTGPEYIVVDPSWKDPVKLPVYVLDHGIYP